jgi:GNAT superfamily N-acetyltransferase
MGIEVTKTGLKNILNLRSQFLAENNFQVRYHACHERKGSDSYLISLDEIQIGYGSVKGKEDLDQRDAIFEFYLLPPFRNLIGTVFPALLKSSGASLIECQTNEPVLTSLLYEFGEHIYSDVILLEEGRSTEWNIPGVKFRPVRKEEPVFTHYSEPRGDYVLEREGQILATGGFLLHYNWPFADLYMEVEENFRKAGLGSLIIQELRKECYLAGRVPAARCNISNPASKATLIKGGLRPCAYMLTGKIRKT